MLKALSEEPERREADGAHRFLSLPDFSCKLRARSLVLTPAVNMERESDPTDKGLGCQGRREGEGGVKGEGMRLWRGGGSSLSQPELCPGCL